MSYRIHEIKYLKDEFPITYQIIYFLANGWTHKEIRIALSLSSSSLRNRMEGARDRYRCRTDRQLIAKAVINGSVRVLDAH